MLPKLAIVIPAYKHQFLRETLASIARQTCKDFNLYIGDDASPNPIGEIVEEFRGKHDFTYHRFDDNMGSTSLVTHWRRCIEMTRGEEWLMILGDDDYLSGNYIEEFWRKFSEINEKGFNVVRFASIEVFPETKSFSSLFMHPEVEKASDSYFRKLSKESRSSLSEYIFRTSSFHKYGFKDFPLGWHSDDLAWLEFSEFGNIYSINGAVSYISKSNHSISGSQEKQLEKEQAKYLFLRYLLTKRINVFRRDQRIKLILRFEFSVFNDENFLIKDLFLLLSLFANYFSIFRALKVFWHFLLRRFSRSL